MASILDSVKMYCGVLPEDTAFDSDILMDVNAIMVAVNQLGVGPSEPFVVTDSSQQWNEFFGDKEESGLVRTYIAMRTRMLFDAPTSTYVKQALDDSISEFEWRILADVDKEDYENRSNDE